MWTKRLLLATMVAAAAMSLPRLAATSPGHGLSGSSNMTLGSLR